MIEKTRKIVTVLFFIVLSFICCKKSDSNFIDYSTINNVKIVEKFLAVPDNASDQVKGIIADFKKREINSPFLTKFAKENGVPKWDCVIGIDQKNNQNNQNLIKSNGMGSDSTITSEKSGGIAFIPLIDEQTKEVKSYIFCVRLKDSSYAYNTYNKHQILAQPIKSISKWEQTNRLLSVHAYFEAAINKKRKSEFEGNSTAFRHSNVKISFSQNDIPRTDQNSGLTTLENNVKSNVIPSKTCYLHIGSVEIISDDGTSISLSFYKKIDCPNLPEVVVYSTRRSGGGSSSGSGGGFVNSLPSSLNPAFNGWPVANSGFGGSSTNYSYYPGNGPFYVDPNDPFWGSQQEPDVIGRASTLAATLGVSNDQSKLGFLSSDEQMMADIENALLENNIDFDAIISARLVLSVAMNNLEFNENEILNELNNSYGLNISDPIMNAHIIRLFTLKYALSKLENDKLPQIQRKSTFRLLFDTFNDELHLALDLLGFIPVGGEVFDVISGFTYQLQGDKTNAYLSYASAIPFAGYAASSAKAIIHGKKILAVVGVDGLLKANRSQKRLREGLVLVGDQVAHHVITFHERVRNHPIMQMAMRAGFDYNDATQNGKAIAASLNSGNHGSYADKIVVELEKFLNNPPSGGVNPAWAKDKVNELVNRIKTAIDNNPGVHIDNLIF